MCENYFFPFFLLCLFLNRPQGWAVSRVWSHFYSQVPVHRLVLIECSLYWVSGCACLWSVTVFPGSPCSFLPIDLLGSVPAGGGRDIPFVKDWSFCKIVISHHPTESLGLRKIRIVGLWKEPTSGSPDDCKCLT